MLFFAQYLATALPIFAQCLLLLRAELAPGVQHPLPQRRQVMGFMQCIVRISPFDDILHIVEELAAVVMIDHAKDCPVVGFFICGVMRGEPPDQQRDKRQKRDNKR